MLAISLSPLPCHRAIVPHEAMNVTLKLPDDLCKAARHRAIDESKSLSAWMADLVKRELNKSTHQTTEPMTWMDAFSGDENDEYLSRDFPLEDRKAGKVTEFNFNP